MAQPPLLPAGSSIPRGLWGSHAPLLDLACLEHSPLVFAPPQRQFQLTAALSIHPAQHSWLSPPSPRRSPVTGQGAKSLFAKQPERIHFLLALPLRTRLRAYTPMVTCGETEWSVGEGEDLEGKQSARA